MVKQWKLVQLRDENGLSQKEVANKLGMNVSTYRYKESGDFDFKLTEMFHLARLFQKPMDEIFLPSKFVDDEVIGH